MQFAEKSLVQEYYSHDFVAEQLAANAVQREVAFCYENGSYDSRPNVLQYKSDVQTLVKKGITSFHYSVEKWSAPMALAPERYNELRTGWDLLIDMDSKIGMIGSQLCALEILGFLRKFGIKNCGIKFSGSRGFHLCLPSKMFPKEVNFRPLFAQYPDVPRIIINFIRDGIKQSLMKSLLQKKPAKELIETIGEAPSELTPFFFVDVENSWGARHMFRAPFSLNEKKWLVSVPLEENEIKNFSDRFAKPENVVRVKHPEFFKGEENEAETLLIEALDWFAKQEKTDAYVSNVAKNKTAYEGKIYEPLFPPCIKFALNGLSDGRKRTVFTLANFLRIANWSWLDIEKKLVEWNMRNNPPLPSNVINTQLRAFMRNEYKPPNCDSGQFIESVGLCRPDAICKRGTDKISIKNPIAYPFRAMDKKKKEQMQKDAERASYGKQKEKKKPELQYKCSRCDSAYASMKGLDMHISRSHGG